MSEFHVGELWRISSGKYAKAQVVICEILDHEKIGLSIHIRIPGPIPGQSTKDKSILHIPFSEEALKASLLKKDGTSSDIGDLHKEGFEYWLEEFKNGNAGIFSVSVSEAIDLIFETESSGCVSE